MELGINPNEGKKKSRGLEKAQPKKTAENEVEENLDGPGQSNKITPSRTGTKGSTRETATTVKENQNPHAQDGPQSTDPCNQNQHCTLERWTSKAMK